MSGYIKYFDDGGKNMLFVSDDRDVLKSMVRFGLKLGSY